MGQVESIRVSTLLEDKAFDLRLELIAGQAGTTRRIVSSRIQKPGLALTGFTEHIHPERLAVFGHTEMSFLATLPPEQQAKVCDQLCALDLSCLVVTKNLVIPDVLIEAARRLGTKVAAVPIEVRYAGEFRRSHFKPLRDFCRITSHVFGRVVEVGSVIRTYGIARTTPIQLIDPDQAGTATAPGLARSQES